MSILPADNSVLPSLMSGPTRSTRIRVTRPFIAWDDGDVEQSIPLRFEQQVRLYPHRAAVRDAHSSTSYDQLNRLANRIARAILAHQKSSAQPVALLLDKNALLMAALLGVLKAGQICVPLEPSYPEHRNAFVLEDSEATLIVCDSPNLALAQSLAKGNARVFNASEFDGEVDGEVPSENLDLSIPAGTPANIIYTSGSTGKPKGVLQNHRNILQHVRNYTGVLHFNCEDRITLLASCNVGQGFKTAMSTLLNGACLYPRDMRSDGVSGLAEWLIRQEISVHISAATIFRHFVKTLDGSQQFPHLRLIRIGSEPVRARDVEMYQQYFGSHCLFMNSLSSTETGNICMHLIDRNARFPDGVVPVGHPESGTGVLLLGEDGKDVGIDNIGEIAVQSRYLSPGYWRRPELTQAAFAETDCPGERVYRTGDLGLRRADGCLEHHGRKDFQVKIRGFRIELKEIEALLQQHPAVEEAVLVALPDEAGDNQLIAFVVPGSGQGPGSAQTPGSGQTPTIGEVRDYLRELLPSHMIPARITFVDSLPLSSNGKVDRYTLRASASAPVGTEIQKDGDFVAPCTPFEKGVADIWKEVLGCETIGVQSSFFDMGGHSLTATMVTSRVREQFHVELPLPHFLAKPTITDIAAFIEASRAGKEPFLTLPSSEFPLLPVSRGEVLPLSFAQQRLWFLDRLESGNTTYNLARAVRLRGVLDDDALQRALNEMVRRHESLRTSFELSSGQPSQKIAPPKPLPIERVDLREVPAAEREKCLQEKIQREYQRPFDLERGPLLRVTLFCTDAAEHLLLITMHHIISDRWSRRIFTHELTTLYAAFAGGKASPLPELPLQYADFAVWQRDWLSSQALKNQLAYWKRQLAGAIPVLELPTDRPRPAILSGRGDSRSRVLPLALTQALKDFSRAENATLFMTLLAAFQTLLHRYTQQEDVLVGSPIANRNRVEVENLIGFFVNTLVLRTGFSGDPTFRELLARVRETALEAYAHQDVPFEKIVEELQPPRDPTRTPFFQVLFALQNAPAQDLELAGLSVSVLPLKNPTSKFDLSLSLTETEAGITAVMEYSTDLFDAETVARMLGHFEVLLEGIVANPDQSVSKLPLLTDAEKRQLVTEWNATLTEYPRSACIHELFAAQAEQTPLAPAITFGDETLSYAALESRANRLARHLQKLGVGADVMVGICVERSLEMVIGLLAILKAGGAYVPLDPGYPEQRLAFILDDAKIGIILAQQKFLHKIPDTTARVLCIETLEQELAREVDSNTASNTSARDSVSAESLAYVIYTSGSTGEPKGVCIPHRGVVRLAKNTDYARLGSDEVHLLLAPLAFDASTFEIWGCLLNGGHLQIFPPMAPSLDELASFVGERGITTLWITTGLFHQLAEKQFERMSRLRQLLTGGEILSPAHARRVLQSLPQCRFINCYGPTESTTFASTFSVCNSSDTDATIPIGRPIANTRIYILDAQRQLVPIGVAGEIYIGGDGLARGYLAHPHLTSEKFLPDPFRRDPDARMYRSGDLGRYRPDGNIEFLGRRDQQVKLRGYRIELGEIETVLSRHQNVRDCVILAPTETGEKRLIAYVVPLQESAYSPTELREYLQAKLPNYMVPSAFVKVQELPLTANGKIDRSALPAPDGGRPDGRQPYIAPGGSLQYQLAKVWEELLDVRPIGVRDDFFELGGHSLLAVRMLDEIEQLFGEKIPLAALFAEATIEHLAATLLSGAREKFQLPMLHLQNEGDSPRFFYLHGGLASGGFYCLNLARHLGAEQPFSVLHPHGLDGRPIPPTIEAMASDYLETLQAFQPHGPYLLGGFCNGGLVAFEMARQLEQKGEQVDLLALVDSKVENLGYKPLKTIVEVSGKLLGHSAQERRNRFLLSRKICRHLHRSWRELQSKPRREKMVSITRGVLRPADGVCSAQQAVRRNKNHLASQSRQEQKRSEIQPRTATTENLKIGPRHIDAISAFIPQHYAGRVTLLRSSESHERDMGDGRDAACDWRKVADDVEVRLVPGGHLDILTTNVAALGEALSDCLQRARAANSSSD